MSAWCKRDENKEFSLKDCCGGECPCPSPSLSKWVNGSHWGGWIPSLQEREQTKKNSLVSWFSDHPPPQKKEPTHTEGIEGGGASGKSGGGGNKGGAGGEGEMGKRGEAIDAIKPKPFCQWLC